MNIYDMGKIYRTNTHKTRGEIKLIDPHVNSRFIQVKKARFIFLYFKVLVYVSNQEIYEWLYALKLRSVISHHDLADELLLTTYRSS